MTGYTRTILLTLILALALGAFPHVYKGFESSNELSRLYLAASLVKYQTITITPVLNEWGDTTDKSARGNDFYSDKAPGSSWLAVFPVLILRGASFTSGIVYSRDQTLVFARVFAVTFPCLLFFVFLYRSEWHTFLFADESGNSAPTQDKIVIPAVSAVTIAYALGTPAWVYSTLFYSHQLTAIALFTAYLLLRPTQEQTRGLSPLSYKQLGAGFLLGFAIALDYPAIWGVICIIVYAMRRGGAARKGWFWGGFVGPVILLCAYHWATFGGPFITGYSFKAYARDAAVHASGFLGISRPTVASLVGILVSHKRGLFFYAPWLIFAIPGFVRMARLKTLRADFELCLAVVVGHTLIIGSFSDWQAGWSYGPRHLMPMLPFLLPALMIEFNSAHRYEKIVISCLVGISIVITAMAVSTFPHVPTLLNNPVTDLFIALIKAGDMGPIIGSSDNRVVLSVIIFIAVAAIVMVCVALRGKDGWAWSAMYFCAAIIVATIWIYSFTKIPAQQNSNKHFAMGQVYGALGDHEKGYLEIQPLTLEDQSLDMRIYAAYMLWRMAEDMNDEAGTRRWRKEYEFLLNQKGQPPGPVQ